MKKLTALLLLVTLFSCRAAWVPAYNNEIVTQINTTAKAIDKLYFELAEADGPQRAYAVYRDKYINLQVELNDLYRKEQARDKGAELVTITANIIEQFTKYKDRHRAEDINIKPAVVELQRVYLSDHFNTLLKAEKSLK